MHLSQMQKMLVLTTCILSLFALTTIFLEPSGKTKKERSKATYQIRGRLEAELKKLPQDDLIDESFVERLKYFLECDSTGKVSHF